MTGYGVDIWCMDRMVTGRLASGVQVVIQNWYHRLSTPRGMLRGGPEEENGGIDLAEYVGTVGHPRAIASIGGVVSGELSKDDRAAVVEVTATSATNDAGEVYINLEVEGVLHESGQTFALTLAVSAVNVTLLGGVAT